jgi:hypothetical protein
MSFLTASWEKLAIANYEIEERMLKAYLPHKTELDLWQGTCYASLVGFMFTDTKMLGVKIPFHVNFEEVNLRFYVRHKVGNEWRRGVVFIREIVPKPALTLVANTLYNEHYATMPMTHAWETADGEQTVSYRWKCRRQWQAFSVRAARELSPIESGSEAEFITEHYWGYTSAGTGKTIEYGVTHPRWNQYKVVSHEISVDFGLVYGPAFEFLNRQSPKSVMLAEGSAITIEGKRKV